MWGIRFIYYLKISISFLMEGLGIERRTSCMLSHALYH